MPAHFLVLRTDSRSRPLDVSVIIYLPQVENLTGRDRYVWHYYSSYYLVSNVRHNVFLQEVLDRGQANTSGKNCAINTTTGSTPSGPGSNAG